jgi:hypothetical protein
MLDGVVDPAISGIDPATGNAIPGGQGTTNAVVNFGWENVWHCHILGHEASSILFSDCFCPPRDNPHHLYSLATQLSRPATYPPPFEFVADKLQARDNSVTNGKCPASYHF